MYSVSRQIMSSYSRVIEFFPPLNDWWWSNGILNHLIWIRCKWQLTYHANSMDEYQYCVLRKDRWPLSPHFLVLSRYHPIDITKYLEYRAGETGEGDWGDFPPDRINVNSWGGGTGGTRKIQKWAILTDFQLFLLFSELYRWSLNNISYTGPWHGSPPRGPKIFFSKNIIILINWAVFEK